MQPLITNPTFNAVLQIVIAVGALASAASPLVKGVPWLYSFLQRLAGAGFDLSKVLGARRIPGPNGPTPTAPKPIEPIVTTLVALMLSMVASVGLTLFIMVTLTSSACSLTPQQVKTVTAGALSVEQMACVLAQNLDKEPAEIAAICSIPPELVVEVEGVILAQKRALVLKDAGK